MKHGKKESQTIVEDMIESCAKVVDRDAAIKGIKAICKWFGGQLLYISSSKTTGDNTDELRGILAGEVGNDLADKILHKLIKLYGGDQIYIPMYRKAFKNIIAREIFEQYDGNQKTMREICRKYEISYGYMYSLYHLGKKQEK